MVRAGVSTRAKARAPGGTKATGTKERASTVARWCTSVPSVGSVERIIRTRFVPDEQEEEAIEQVECQTCWMVGQVVEVVHPPDDSWSRPRKLARPKLARWTKSGPPGLGFCAAHGYGCTAACYNLFKVLDEEEDCDVNEVEEEPVNEVVDVTIDSGARRNVWPKGKKVPGKLMPLKKKIKLVAANSSPIDVHGEKDDRVPGQWRQDLCDELPRDGSEKAISLGRGHRRWG